MSRLKIAYFGLPLGACLLAQRGHDVVCAVLPPVPAPGARRLRRLVGAERMVDAGTMARAGGVFGA